MNKLIKLSWAAFALLIAFTLAWPFISAALKVLLVLLFVALPLAGIIYIVRMFTGGGGNRLIR